MSAATTSGFDDGGPDLSTSLGVAEFDAPVFTASGCATAGRELDTFFDITAIGGIVTKSIMAKPARDGPRPGWPRRRRGCSTRSACRGPGIDHFIDHDLAWLRDRGARVVVSITGGTVEEYAALASKLRRQPGIDAIEVNISCPNVESRGLVFACDPMAAGAAVSAVRRNTNSSVPVLAKLSPDVTDLVAIATAVVAAGADGLAMINTTLGMVIDTDTMRPALAGVTGGLSGPAIRPIAVRAVWQVHAALPAVPILGMGGIRSGTDALQFVLAGASAVSVGTAVFNDPRPRCACSTSSGCCWPSAVSAACDAVGYAHRGQPHRLALAPEPS